MTSSQDLAQMLHWSSCTAELQDPVIMLLYMMVSEQSPCRKDSAYKNQ